MDYYSTRDKNRNNNLKASDAILKGLASLAFSLLFLFLSRVE